MRHTTDGSLATATAAPPNAEFSFTYDESVTPTATKFLKCDEPLKIKFEATVTLEPSDAAIVKKIGAEFQKG